MSAPGSANAGRIDYVWLYFLLVKKNKKEWLRLCKGCCRRSHYFSFFKPKKRLCKVKLILPALADPAAAGDPVHPVLYWMLFLRMIRSLPILFF